MTGGGLKMNILNRLSKIEGKLSLSNENSTEFCGCYFAYLFGDHSDDSLYPDLSKPVCGICGNRISKRDVEVEKLLNESYS
jgi:hypothetical protein